MLFPQKSPKESLGAKSEHCWVIWLLCHGLGPFLFIGNVFGGVLHGFFWTQSPMAEHPLAVPDIAMSSAFEATQPTESASRSEKPPPLTPGWSWLDFHEHQDMKPWGSTAL